MGYHDWGQDFPAPKMVENAESSRKDSGLVDHLGRKLVREKVVGFKVERKDQSVKED